MVSNNKNLAIIILTLSMLVLGGFAIFLLVHKKKCDDCKPSKPCKKCKKCTKCKVCPYTTYEPCMFTNEQWMRIRGLDESEDPSKDPYINGYYKFCERNCSNTVLSITNEDWMYIIDTDDKNPESNGYNQFAIRHEGSKSCFNCKFGNKKWIEMNGITEPDPQKNGYNDFCLTSNGTRDDWDKYSTMPADGEYQRYHNFCPTL
jgi:hypothetical protein